jgi:hypothetical protein
VIAFAIRLLATALVLLFLASFLFLSGWLSFSPGRQSVFRRRLVDWACPKCEIFSTAYVSPLWHERARRRALGLCHRRLAPTCSATEQDLLIMS